MIITRAPIITKSRDLFPRALWRRSARLWPRGRTPWCLPVCRQVHNSTCTSSARGLGSKNWWQSHCGELLAMCRWCRQGLCPRFQAGGIMRGRLRLLGEGQRRIHRLAPGGCREQRRCRLGLRTKKCLSRLVRRLWGGCLAQSVGLGGASLYHSVEALRGLQTRRWVVAQGHVAS